MGDAERNSYFVGACTARSAGPLALEYPSSVNSRLSIGVGDTRAVRQLRRDREGHMRWVAVSHDLSVA
jgi:hypothetical protein